MLSLLKLEILTIACGHSPIKIILEMIFPSITSIKIYYMEELMNWKI